MSGAFHLSDAQRRALAGLARAACPPEIQDQGLVDAVVDHTELSLGSLPPLIRGGILAMLLVYENGARPLHRGRPASALSWDEGHGWFERWRRSPVLPMREWVKGTKGLLCMAYYEQPSVKAAIGYTPEAWIEKVKRKRLAVYGEEIKRHERSLFEPDPLPLDDLVGTGTGTGTGTRRREVG